MKKTYKVKLKTRSRNIQNLLKRTSGAYRRLYNLSIEFQFNAALLRGSLNPFLSGSQVLKYMEPSKRKYTFLDELDKGIFAAAIHASTKAFVHKFDYHIENIPFLSRKKTLPKFKTIGNVRVTQDSVILPKIGRIPLYERGRIPLNKRYSNVTISNDGNDWFISLEIEENTEKETLTDNIITLDVTNDGNFILNGDAIQSPTKSKNYTNEEIKLKRALKKLKRQTKTNSKINTGGHLIPVTTRNMVKTVKRVDKIKNRLYNIRKDLFFKVVNGVAITKPKELHILSNSSLRATRNNCLSRAQRRGGTADFLNMMRKKMEILGVRVLRHVSTDEFPQSLRL